MANTKQRQIIAIVLFLISEIFAALTILFLIKYDGHKHLLITAGSTIILNGHGMVIFRLTPGITTYIIKYVHSLIEIIALVGGILGVVMMKNDSQSKKLHVHSFLGYATIILYIIQVVFAIFVYLYMYSNQKRRKIYAACHNFLGIVILQLSIATSAIEMANSDESNSNLDTGVIVMTFYGVMVNSIVLNPYTEWRLVGLL